MSRPVADFWSGVAVGKDDECWPWKRSLIDGRYGQCHRSHDISKRAHRAAWRATHGDIPAGMLVLHRCDNPPCCNPRHLFVGTVLDNVLDCASKGRRAKPMLGRSQSTEAKAKLSAARLGQTLTEQHKAAIGSAIRGMKRRQSTKSAISRALTGKSKSPQHRQALSEAARRRYATMNGE